jgi:L-lactate dehydrogenase (cytochrome)
LYRRVEFNPATLVDVTNVDTSTSFVGRSSALPWVFSPTGVTRVVHHSGEAAVARAAERFGHPYGLSIVSSTSIEDLAAAAPGGRNWLGVTNVGNREWTLEVLERAKRSGYEALVFWLDGPTPGSRPRDRRSGFTMPPQPTYKTLLDGALHPSWWFNFLTTEMITFPNLPIEPGGTVNQINDFLCNPAQTIADFQWLRTVWDGPLIAKGIATVDDAQRLADAGANGIVLSTTGGRQLDQGPLPLRVLPDVAKAVDPSVDLFVDTGILNGSDIIAAIALGAKGAFLGRAYLYGLMAGGEPGVDRANQILTEQLVRLMRQLGVTSLDQLTPDHVRLPA